MLGFQDVFHRQQHLCIVPCRHSSSAWLCFTAGVGLYCSFGMSHSISNKNVAPQNAPVRSQTEPVTLWLRLLSRGMALLATWRPRTFGGFCHVARQSAAGRGKEAQQRAEHSSNEQTLQRSNQNTAGFCHVFGRRFLSCVTSLAPR